MPKKKVHKKVATAKYQHFKLHGNHKLEKIALYIVLDLVISVTLGLLLQNQIVSVLAMH